MLFKETGYDEFLAEKIRQGEQDIAEGRVLTLEQAKTRSLQNLEKKAIEIELAKKEQLNYV